MNLTFPTLGSFMHFSRPPKDKGEKMSGLTTAISMFMQYAEVQRWHIGFACLCLVLGHGPSMMAPFTRPPGITRGVQGRMQIQEAYTGLSGCIVIVVFPKHISVGGAVAVVMVVMVMLLVDVVQPGFHGS